MIDFNVRMAYGVKTSPGLVTVRGKLSRRAVLSLLRMLLLLLLLHWGYSVVATVLV